MPIYRYTCGKCSYIWEDYASIEDRYNTTCPDCHAGKPIILPCTPALSIFKPAVYEDIASEPIYIETPQQLRDECDKRGLKSVALENGIFKTRKVYDNVEEEKARGNGDD